MRRILFTLIGLPFLAAGLVLLWMAFGPQPSAERTTGGVLYTQQELADEGRVGVDTANLEAVTDTTAGAMAVGVETQLEGDVALDLQSVDQAEMDAAPQRIEMNANMTTDVVLDDATQVEVAPLVVEASDSLSDGQGGSGSLTTGYEQRVVELEWPSTFHVGRAGLVRVRLKLLEDGSLQPVAEIGDNEVVATPILITDRYDTHNAFVTASIAAPDFNIDWSSPARQGLVRGGEVEWRWTLESDDAVSDTIITLGLTLTWEAFAPDAAPAPSNVPIWGQTLQVDVDHVFGLITVPQASIFGTVLALLGLIAQFPLLEKLLEAFLDALFDRDKRDHRESSSERNRRR